MAPVTRAGMRRQLDAAAAAAAAAKDAAAATDAPTCSRQCAKKEGSSRTVRASLIRVLICGIRKWQRGARLARAHLFSQKKPERVVLALLVANVLVFAAWTCCAWASDSRKWTRFMYKHFTVSTSGVLDKGRAYTLFTAIFSHHSLYHLLFNCITLYAFCSYPARRLGTRTFLGLYVMGGLVSSLGSVAWARFLATPRFFKWARILGASGALNAILLWVFLAVPPDTMFLYMFVPLPARLCGTVHLLGDLYGLYRNDSNVCHAGHLSGAAVGAVFWWITRKSWATPPVIKSERRDGYTIELLPDGRERLVID